VDNQAAIDISKKEGNRYMAKHINLSHLFIQDMPELGEFEIEFNTISIPRDFFLTFRKESAAQHREYHSTPDTNHCIKSTHSLVILHITLYDVMSPRLHHSKSTEDI
jgi:hypothetical protein